MSDYEVTLDQLETKIVRADALGSAQDADSPEAEYFREIVKALTRVFINHESNAPRLRTLDSQVAAATRRLESAELQADAGGQPTRGTAVAFGVVGVGLVACGLQFGEWLLTVVGLAALVAGAGCLVVGERRRGEGEEDVDDAAGELAALEKERAKLLPPRIGDVIEGIERPASLLPLP
ncbi:MAG TPA: hypothetical protein VK486_06315 [Thermoleophilaceae bacterium]|nr:hypothetical protein [Thermoleophilaceae bacterium]